MSALCSMCADCRSDYGVRMIAALAVLIFSCVVRRNSQSWSAAHIYGYGSQMMNTWFPLVFGSHVIGSCVLCNNWTSCKAWYPAPCYLHVCWAKPRSLWPWLLTIWIIIANFWGCRLFRLDRNESGLASLSVLPFYNIISEIYNVTLSLSVSSGFMCCLFSWRNHLTAYVLINLLSLLDESKPMTFFGDVPR